MPESYDSIFLRISGMIDENIPCGSGRMHRMMLAIVTKKTIN